MSIEEICLRNKRFKEVFEGLDRLHKIHTEEKDPEKIPEILGEIVGKLILIQTDIDGYQDHLKEGEKTDG